MNNDHLEDVIDDFQGQFNRIENDYQLNVAIEAIKKAYNQHGTISVQIKTPDLRSMKQNNAIHLWFRLLAKKLANEGFTLNQIVKIPLVITPYDVKERMWKTVMQSHCQKKSTTKLTKKEVTEILDIIVLYLGETYGIECPPFPSYEES